MKYRATKRMRLDAVIEHEGAWYYYFYRDISVGFDKLRLREAMNIIQPRGDVWKVGSVVVFRVSEE